ncbi:MAG: undecaprenyl diphosphate synthase family protein, partial [Patescibacteria group bacterium]
ALDYGGRDEMLRAVEQIKNLNDKVFDKFLDTKDLPYPNPDLIIRTGGEHRLSGFLLWQSQYSELMFVKKYLPDFKPEDFEGCINSFVKRQRRFGK